MEAILIEGHASLFGVEDLMGDVVRAGAFAQSLRGGTGPPVLVPMLLGHAHGRVAGRWVAAREDGRGLYVRGLVEGGTRAGDAALAAIADGLDGLSIGFRAQMWRPRIAGGRELMRVNLIEVSLVSAPALPGARFRLMAPERKRALG